MTGASSQSNRTPFLRKPLDTGGVLVLVLSIAASVFGYSTLPSQTQIHWALGGPYYGPEYVSTPIVLIGFPLLVAGFYAGSRWLRGHLAQIEGFDAVRPLYHGCLLLLFAGILIVQFVIILLNLH